MSVKLRVNDGCAVVAVQGQFNFTVNQLFRETTLEAINTPHLRRLEINLNETVYLDSSALGMLLVMAEDAKIKGIEQLALTGAKPAVRKVLDMAKFSKFFSIE